MWSENFIGSAEIAPMPEKKLPLGFGYVFTWLRDRENLSQSQFARKFKEPSESYTAVLSAIKSIEANRKRAPIVLLERANKKFVGLKTNWWQFVPPPEDTSLQVTETRAAYPRRNRKPYIPGVWFPVAPDDRLPNLRSVFVIDKSRWKNFEEFPPYFTFPGMKGGATKELEEYPDVFADKVCEGDPDVDGEKVRVGDRFAVRTDLTPTAGDLVLATGKKGERLRRLLVVSDGHLVLRHFTLKLPDVLAQDVNMIEGVLRGRLRRFEGDSQGVLALFISDGRMGVHHL